MIVLLVSAVFLCIFLLVLARLRRSKSPYVGLVFFPCFFAFISVITRLHLLPFFANDTTIREIEGSFKGRIVDRLIEHSNILTININDKEIKVYGIESELLKLSEIGDSIFKIPNDDSVYLIKRDTTLKLQYLVVDSQDYENPLWPKKWQNRWKSVPEFKRTP